MATAAWLASATTRSSADSPNTPVAEWPKNSPPSTSPVRAFTGTAR